jgi:hypothetical protein
MRDLTTFQGLVNVWLRMWTAAEDTAPTAHKALTEMPRSVLRVKGFARFRPPAR